LSPDRADQPQAITFRIAKKAVSTDEADDADADTEAAEDTTRDEPEPIKPVAGKSFLAELAEWDGAKFQAGSEESATAVAGILQSAAYVVSKVEQKDRPERPLPPFTTSTLQQQANIRFHFPAERTMKLAQQLYEGVELGTEGAVALITYMRTDSTRVAEDALKSCRDHIQSNYGPHYLPESPNRYTSGKSAQEAHEAIRPTDLAYTPERVAAYLTEPQRKLYDLIYRRFVASQMKPAIFAVTNVEVRADKGLFKAQGKILKFDGYRRVLAPRGKQEDATLPSLAEKQNLDLLDLLASQHFTQPPPRYNEASLVKALEKEGIGRPSTYAAIMAKIKDRSYVELKERRFYATPLGKLVTDKLVAHFPRILDIKFTSHMEEELDEIESRKIEYRQVLDEFWVPFREALDAAQEGMEAIKGRETGENCPKCGAPLVTRYSAKLHREFVGCSAYPDCNYIKREDGDESGAPVETEHKCPTCGKNMLQRMGKSGSFLGCSGYPECKTTMNLDAEGKPVPTAQLTEHLCDKCRKPMVLRQGRRGPFLGCSGYPKCKNIQEVDAEGNPVKPVDTGIKCEKCQSPMFVKRGPRGPFLGCSAYPKCRGTQRIPDDMKEKLKELLPAPRPKPQLPKVHIEETCPDCGAALELRQGRRGYFLGCTMYGKTKCTGTMEVPPEVRDQIQQQQTPTHDLAAK
jgi:DNA topoisomerase-1